VTRQSQSAAVAEIYGKTRPSSLVGNGNYVSKAVTCHFCQVLEMLLGNEHLSAFY